jgi:catechol 2,3-dioxygenase-like lactoylglutathione lyase family enzyme
MIQPIGLVRGHYQCRSFGETMPILTDLLALEPVRERNGEVMMRHPNTDWLLVVHEGGPTAPDKPLMNHYGVRVARREEVDAAWKYLRDHKEKYGLSRITKPVENHFAYSFYFKEPGGNYLEIEFYDPAALAEGRSIAAPPWKNLLGEDRFPARGYVPQALSHGTLECDDKQASERFYRDVLGLEIVGGGRVSLYIKHPATPWYIVVIPGRKRTYLSPSNRLALEMASTDEVKEAHRRLETSGERLGVTRLEAIQQQEGEISFKFCDLDRNWWEIAAGAGRLLV